MMLKRTRIGIEILVLVILLIGEISVASASADSSQDTQSKGAFLNSMIQIHSVSHYLILALRL